LNKAKLLALITDKWPVKVLSLGAAILISVFYRMNTLESRFFTVPLIVESSESLVPSSVFAASVRISLRGEADGIQPILEQDVEAYIDLGKYTNEGSYRVPVQIRKKGSALGVEPLEISVQPIEIPMVLEQKISRNIPVFPALTGTVAEGFELTYQTIIPGSVTAEGPRSALDIHSGFSTEIISLDRRYEDFSIIVNVINYNPLITIQGNRMLEFRALINRIAREEHREEALANAEENETGGEDDGSGTEENPHNGDDE